MQLQKIFSMRVSRKVWVRPELFFLLVLIVLALLYDYQQIFFLKPVGIHQWRSCVSAAFPVNLASGGGFFTTQTNALLADNYTSDVTVIEFPLIYFIVSLFYRVFGVNEFWFRAFQVAIGFTGLIYLFKASYYFTRDWLYAAFVPLVIFTSPIYVFYLNNFIPDAMALSLIFIGFYFFLKHVHEKRFRLWWLSMLFFLLAGLSKTASLLPFIAMGVIALFDFIRRLRDKRMESYFQFDWRYIVTYLLVFLLIFAWYFYAKWYSDAHGESASAVEIRPIWRLNSESISEVLQSMNRWFITGNYHSKIFLILSAGLLVALPFFRRSANRFLYSMSILVFLGAFSFTLLFFRSMKQHDYYQINNLFIFVPLYLTLFSILSTRVPRIYRSVWTKLVLGMVVLFMILNAYEWIHLRYSNEDRQFYSSNLKIYRFDIEEYLEEIGIDQTATVYCTPDPSINISLYMCNRKGITDFALIAQTTNMEERLEKIKEAGIEYVILGSRKPYEDVENLDELLGEKVGEIRETEIFRLTSDKQ